MKISKKFFSYFAITVLAFSFSENLRAYDDKATDNLIQILQEEVDWISGSNKSNESEILSKLEAILNSGANPNTPKMACPPLWYALRSHSCKITQLLLKHGANPNFMGSYHNSNHRKETFLYVFGVSIKMAQLLLAFKADINAKSECYRGSDTLLFMKVRENNEKMVNFLLSQKANPNIGCFSKNDMPIHVAVYNNNIKMVTLLLKYGADINASNDNGMTSLCWAVDGRNIKMVAFLLTHGADLSQYEPYDKNKRIEKITSLLEHPEQAKLCLQHEKWLEDFSENDAIDEERKERSKKYYNSLSQRLIQQPKIDDEEDISEAMQNLFIEED